MRRQMRSTVNARVRPICRRQICLERLHHLFLFPVGGNGFTHEYAGRRANSRHVKVACFDCKFSKGLTVSVRCWLLSFSPSHRHVWLFPTKWWEEILNCCLTAAFCLIQLWCLISSFFFFAVAIRCRWTDHFNSVCLRLELLASECEKEKKRTKKRN